MKLIDKAIRFSTKAHLGQVRKGSDTPYICHPIAVGFILTMTDCEEEVIAAGILHDTVEDTDVTLEDIRTEFGDRVMQIVAGASEPDKSLSWFERKQHTIEYLRSAPLEIRMVTCADKLHNLRSIQEDYLRLGDDLWSRFNAGKEQQAWYYRGLVDSLCFQEDIPTGVTLFKEFQQEVERFF